MYDANGFGARGYGDGVFYAIEAHLKRALIGSGSSQIEMTNGIRFNAHNSNSVYTDSGKVYPLSLALNFIIKS